MKALEFNEARREWLATFSKAKPTCREDILQIGREEDIWSDLVCKFPVLLIFELIK